MTTLQPQEPWHLDKRVPVVLISTIVVQTIGIVWWAATLDHQVEQHERRLVQLESADARLDTEARRLSELLVRVDERLAAQNQILQRLEQSLRQPSGR